MKSAECVASSPARCRAASAIFAVLAVFALAVWREPKVFIEPRLWAEEGANFLGNAVSSSDMFDSLLYVRTSADGYFQLPATFGSTIASLLPLEYAPAVMLGVSLLYFLLPFILIWTGRSLLWGDTFKLRSLASAIVLFAPTSIGEVWMNTINAQVYAGIATFLILFEDSSRFSSRRVKILCATLFVCGLSGIYSVLLLPAFVFRASVKRDSSSYLFAASLGMAALIQVVVFVYSYITNPLNPQRFRSTSWSSALLKSVVYQLVTPLVGTLGIETIYSLREGSPKALENLLLLLPSALVGVTLLFGMLKSKELTRDATYILLTGALSIISVLFFTTIASYDGQAGGRYAVVNGVLLLWLLLYLARVSTSRLITCSIGAALASALLIGAYSYRKDVYGCTMDTCPNWRSELELAAQSERYCPLIMPYAPPKVRWRVCFK